MQYEQTNIQMQEERVKKHNHRANICLLLSILCPLFGIGQVITDSYLITTDSHNDILNFLSLLGMPFIAGICGVLGIIFFAISGSAKYKARRIIGLILSIIGIILDVLCFVYMIVAILIGG